MRYIRGKKKGRVKYIEEIPTIYSIGEPFVDYFKNKSEDCYFLICPNCGQIFDPELNFSTQMLSRWKEDELTHSSEILYEDK